MVMSARRSWPVHLRPRHCRGPIPPSSADAPVTDPFCFNGRRKFRKARMSWQVGQMMLAPTRAPLSPHQPDRLAREAPPDLLAFGRAIRRPLAGASAWPAPDPRWDVGQGSLMAGRSIFSTLAMPTVTDEAAPAQARTQGGAGAPAGIGHRGTKAATGNQEPFDLHQGGSSRKKLPMPWRQPVLCTVCDIGHPKPSACLLAQTNKGAGVPEPHHWQG